jgi:hypothetical protein
LDNFDKTRINIGHQHDRWMELKEALRVQTQKQRKYAFWSNLAKRRLILMFLKRYILTFNAKKKL